ncbi:MAG: hypothetical protein LUI14_02010, partial [Lachnospiraceae bacterium]|nr:hypothetical protein [Lachnospiraceae bacterium]
SSPDVIDPHLTAGEHRILFHANKMENATLERISLFLLYAILQICQQSFFYVDIKLATLPII